VLDHISGQVQTAVAYTVQRRVDGRLRERIMRASLRPTGIGHLEEAGQRTAFATARDLAPSGFTPGAAARGLIGANSHRLGVFVAVGVLATYSWPLAVLTLVAAVIHQGQILMFLYRNVMDLFAENDDQRRSVYYRDLALTAPAAKESRVFGLRPWVMDRFTSHYSAGVRRMWESQKGGRLSLVTVSPLIGALHGGALAFAALGAINGRFDLGAVAVILGNVGIGLEVRASDMELAMAYGAAAVPAILEAESTATSASLAGSGGSSARGLPTSEISFEDVTFTYPGAERPVFEHLSLEIPAGQRLAIVGLNGAGKTTLVKLLCRLYEPTSGRIVVDGVDLATVDPHEWRRQLAALFQDFARYHLSALENIAWASGRTNGADLQAARTAAERVGALTTIDSLGRGWDTVLAPQYDGGADLSGGQWQRVALARALAKVDAGAQLLILDEPTANLDARGEAELYDRFIDITAAVNREHPLTTILISHRFSTVRRADRVVVLEEGRVIEDGTHAQLVEHGGRYARLFLAQAARFSE
jgi:ATP-binding cassette subfamily B protein